MALSESRPSGDTVAVLARASSLKPRRAQWSHAPHTAVRVMVGSPSSSAHPSTRASSSRPAPAARNCGRTAMSCR